jgi:hypothetical protein
MQADRERVLQPRASSPWPGWLIIYLVMMVVSYVLHQMVETSETLSTTVTFAVFARVFWIICAK